MRRDSSVPTDGCSDASAHVSPAWVHVAMLRCLSLGHRTGRWFGGEPSLFYDESWVSGMPRGALMGFLRGEEWQGVAHATETAENPDSAKARRVGSIAGWRPRSEHSRDPELVL